ncbi:hypothetical protein BaRGS_00037127 [Batillaria attramentaria]|uniref:Protein vein n=1 Tax=Batillaria attramentaria TaxID=370345 RepID=A0ABD0J9W4_9CAEN
MAGVYLFSFLLCAWSVLPRARAQESDIAADPQRQYACGTKFTDAASSALLADVVLQGSVDDLRQASPLAPLLYKANVTVQKVYKGQELLSGGASSSRSRVRYVQVERFGPDENAENCVARVTTGQTYLFFLKIKDDQNGQRQSSSSSSASSGGSSSSVSPLSVTSTDSARAVDSAQTVFVNSALPKEMDLKVLRQAKRVLCPGCASEPVIKRLRCKNCAVRPKMRRKMSPSDTKIVRLGKRLTLRCVARAVPKPSYTWYKDGQRLGDLPEAASGSSTSTRARAATVFRSGGLSIRTTRRHSLLTVKSVTTSDQGVYRCVAANAVGEAEQTAEVLIEGNPSLAGVTPPDVTSSLCDVNICYHGGTCYNDEEGGRPRCVCTADYHGRKCQFSRRRIQPEPAEEEGGAVEGQGSEVTPGEGVRLGTANGAIVCQASVYEGSGSV